MATKSKSKAKAQKAGVKYTFQAVHGVCPELVNLFDYMVDQDANGTSGVNLRLVQRYADNIQETLQELVGTFGPETPLSEIEDLREIEDLSC